jgi:hypothetical protein
LKKNSSGMGAAAKSQLNNDAWRAKDKHGAGLKHAKVVDASNEKAPLAGGGYSAAKALGQRLVGLALFGWHFSPRYFAVKTPSVDDTQCGPCNKSSDTRE